MNRLPIALAGSTGKSQPHKGLFLEKHLPPKTGSIRSIAPDLEALCRMPSTFPAYQLAFARWEKLWQDRSAAESVVLRKALIQGRLATGLGQSSVHEISCRLHHIYGVPWLPGSGIRGALRSRLETVTRGGEVVADPSQAVLFGSTEEAGFLTVHDAWWVPDRLSGLALDVLTPHHSDYYTGANPKPPADSDSPTPVSFLSFTGSFLFVLEAPNHSWRDYASKLLDDVLEHTGLGSKRSSGYGRFNTR